MSVKYIKQEDLEEFLERNRKSFQDTCDKYRDKKEKIGTVADGCQIGMATAFEFVLRLIRGSDIFNHCTILEIDNPDDSIKRTDFANQFKRYVYQTHQGIMDYGEYQIIEKWINKWLEEMEKNDKRTI